jgi:hypothetical protein
MADIEDLVELDDVEGTTKSIQTGGEVGTQVEDGCDMDLSD